MNPPDEAGRLPAETPQGVADSRKKGECNLREQLTDEQWEAIMAVCHEHCPQMRNGMYEPRCIGCPVEETCQRVTDMDATDWTQMYEAVKSLKEGN